MEGSRIEVRLLQPSSSNNTLLKEIQKLLESNGFVVVKDEIRVGDSKYCCKALIGDKK